MANDADYSNLTLHGRFTHDGEAFTIYADLNGVEVPVQRLSVADYREAFTDAANAAPSPSESQPEPSQTQAPQDQTQQTPPTEPPAQSAQQ